MLIKLKRESGENPELSPQLLVLRNEATHCMFWHMGRVQSRMKHKSGDLPLFNVSDSSGVEKMKRWFKRKICSLFRYNPFISSFDPLKFQKEWIFFIS